MLPYHDMSGHVAGQIQGLVARNIVRAIEDSGLTRAEVARHMQTDPKAVRRWCNADVTPNRTNMQRLALLLKGGDVGWFYTDHSNKGRTAA